MFLLFSLPVMSSALRHHRLQHTRPPCPSPSPKVCPSSCPLHWWCHAAILSSDTLFFFCPQSFQHQGLFQWVSCSHQMTKILELQLQHQSFQQVFRIDFPWAWPVWSLCCPGDFQESSPAPQFKGINSLAFCLLYGPALTSIHEHWEHHNLDCMDSCWQSNVSAFQHTV